jgi:hypothetical protein
MVYMRPRITTYQYKVDLMMKGCWRRSIRLIDVEALWHPMGFWPTFVEEPLDTILMNWMLVAWGCPDEPSIHGLAF